MVEPELRRRCPQDCPLSDAEFDDLQAGKHRWAALDQEFHTVETELMAAFGHFITLMADRAKLVQRMGPLIDKLAVPSAERGQEPGRAQDPDREDP